MGAVGIFRRFLAVILTILFSFFLVLLIGVFFINNTFNESNIYNKTNNYFSSNTSNLKNDEVLGPKIKELVKLGIPEEIVDKLLDNKKLKEITSSYAYGYSNYILKNDKKPTIDPDAVKKIITEEINKNGYILDESTTKSLDKYLEETINKINDNTIDRNQIDGIGVDIKTIEKTYSIISSPITLIAIVIGLVVSFLLTLLCLKNIVKAMKYISISFLIVGTISVACFILEVKYMSTLINSNGLIDNLVLNMFDSSFELLLIIGIILIVLGIILLIVGYILGRRTHEKSDNLLENIIEEEVDKSYKNNLRDHVVAEDTNLDEVGQDKPNEEQPQEITPEEQ